MLMTAHRPLAELENATEFVARHIGIGEADEQHMLTVIGAASRRALIEAIVPRSIARARPMALPPVLGEAQALEALRRIAAKNVLLKSCIGQGYHGTHTPGVILRNILENPAWYTAYTPYQAEISQGRLEALLNFQTLVCDLTGMAIAGSSMLDEATAAAEAMTLAMRVGKSKSQRFFVADDVLPQTLEVVRTRATPLGIEVVTGEVAAAGEADAFAVLLQYPAVDGVVRDLAPTIAAVHAKGGLAIVAADLLALTLIKSPGDLGADIAVGNTQRFGMPMGNGGPHAAYLATRDEFKRSMPGRLVGLSIDAHGAPAYRLALQTREQHIRREKATSNICTAQVLPAVVASMYAVVPRAGRAQAHRAPRGELHGGAGRGGCANSVSRSSATAPSTHCCSTPARAPTRCSKLPARLATTCAAPRTLASASRSTRPPRATTSPRCGRCSPAGKPLPSLDAFEAGIAPLITPAMARSSALPHAPGVQQPPVRNADAALHPPPLGQGPGARPHDDPARLLHDEAERHERDDPDHLARVRERAPRSRRATSSPGYDELDAQFARLALPGDRLCRHQPAAERRLAGRIRRAAGDPRLPRGTRREPPERLPDPRNRRTAPTRRARRWRACRWSSRSATPKATSTSPTCAPSASSTARTSPA